MNVVKQNTSETNSKHLACDREKACERRLRIYHIDDGISKREAKATQV